MQVKNKSSAVLLSEILRFVLPGTRIISDALASYGALPSSATTTTWLSTKKEFVQSEDRSVHTQNIEIRNQWTKNAVKSYRGDRALNSYCAEYSYRLVYVAY